MSDIANAKALVQMYRSKNVALANTPAGPQFMGLRNVTAEHLNRLAELVHLPEWEFIQVCHEGLLSEPHAGCTYNGTYYGEHVIAAAYFNRNPGADALW